MKKLLCLSMLVAMLASAQYAYSQDIFSPNEGPWFRFRLSGLLLGYFAMTWEASGEPYINGDPFNELTLALEIRPFAQLGFELYSDLKGYRWWDIAPTDTLGVIWGMFSYKVGGGVCYHFFDSASVFDLGVGVGIELADYRPTDIDHFLGFGMSTRVNFVWRPTSFFGIGLEGAAHWSTHQGGTYVSNPSMHKYPFQLYEIAVGIVTCLYF
jgi:hypothetical protein